MSEQRTDFHGFSGCCIDDWIGHVDFEEIIYLMMIAELTLDLVTKTCVTKLGKWDEIFVVILMLMFMDEGLDEWILFWIWNVE